MGLANKDYEFEQQEHKVKALEETKDTPMNKKKDHFFPFLTEEEFEIFGQNAQFEYSDSPTQLSSSMQCYYKVIIGGKAKRPVPAGPRRNLLDRISS